MRNHDCHASKELRDALPISTSVQSQMPPFNEMQPFGHPLKHSPPSAHDSGDELSKAEAEFKGTRLRCILELGMGGSLYTVTERSVFRLSASDHQLDGLGVHQRKSRSHRGSGYIELFSQASLTVRLFSDFRGRQLRSAVREASENGGRRR